MKLISIQLEFDEKILFASQNVTWLCNFFTKTSVGINEAVICVGIFMGSGKNFELSEAPKKESITFKVNIDY